MKECNAQFDPEINGTLYQCQLSRGHEGAHGWSYLTNNGRQWCYGEGCECDPESDKVKFLAMCLGETYLEEQRAIHLAHTA